MLVLLGSRGFRAIPPAQWLATAALGGTLAAGWWIMSPPQNAIPPAIALETALSSGKPTLVEFQSPFCLGCLMAKPVVDGLRTTMLESVTFVSVNVIEPGGYAIAQKYGLRGTPQFVYIDANGKEQWRKYGVPNEAEFRAALTAP